MAPSMSASGVTTDIAARLSNVCFGSKSDIRQHLGCPKSGRHMVAKGMQFSWQWDAGAISRNLGVVWRQSGYKIDGVGPWALNGHLTLDP